MPRNKKLGQPIPAEPPEESLLLSFQCAEVKIEALDDDDDYEFAPEQELAFPFQKGEDPRSFSTNSVAVQTMRRPIMSRSVQVDLQQINHETLLADVQPWGGLAADGPLKANGSTVRQCRICLRRLPKASLSYIVSAQKVQIFTALDVKVYVGDAYPLICRNCAGLVELIYDFRNTCMRARNMLVQERKSIENNDWDSAKNLEIVEQCRALVQTHKREIDAAYRQPSVPLLRQREVKENVDVKPEATELVLLEQSMSKESMVEEENESFPEEEPKDVSTNYSRKIDLKLEAPDSHLSDQSDFSATDDEDPVYKQPPSDDDDDDKDEEDPDCKSSSDDDDDDDGDFAPSLSSVPRKRRVRNVTKPYKKQVKKKKPSKKEAGSKGEGETVIQKPIGTLCDFCGKYVCAGMMESHKNQHLGIKPYACQIEGCEWTFTSRMLLLKHLKRKHNADGPEYHDCKMCGQRIKGPMVALRKHQQTHTQKTKDFVCPICGKGFTNSDYLRKHKYVHNDLMPFECSVCQRKFNNKYNMLKHEKKHLQRGEASN